MMTWDTGQILSTHVEYFCVESLELLHKNATNCHSLGCLVTTSIHSIRFHHLPSCKLNRIPVYCVPQSN